VPELALSAGMLSHECPVRQCRHSRPSLIFFYQNTSPLPIVCSRRLLFCPCHCKYTSGTATRRPSLLLPLHKLNAQQRQRRQEPHKRHRRILPRLVANMPAHSRRVVDRAIPVTFSAEAGQEWDECLPYHQPLLCRSHTNEWSERTNPHTRKKMAARTSRQIMMMACARPMIVSTVPISAIRMP